MADTYLLGVGYRHVKGGEDDFERAGQKVKASAQQAQASVYGVDEALAAMAASFAGLNPALSATSQALRADVAAMQAHREATANDAAASGVLAAQLKSVTLALDKEAVAAEASAQAQQALLTVKRVADASLKAGLIDEAQRAKLLNLAREQYERLSPEVQKATAATEANAAATQKAVGSMMSWGKLLLAGALLAGLAAFVGFLKGGVDENRQWTESVAQMDAAIANTGGSAGMTSQQLQALASQVQKTTKFTDDQAASAEALMLSYTRITSSVFPRAIELSADLATRLGTDLSGAAQKVAKSLQDPEEGLGSLNRELKLFSNETEQQIKNLMQSGHVLEAQGMILDALQGRVGGAGAAGVNAFTRWSHAVDDLQQAFGDGLVPELEKAVNSGEKLAGNTYLIKFFHDLGTVVGFAVEALGKWVELAERFSAASWMGKLGGTELGFLQQGFGAFSRDVQPEETAANAPAAWQQAHAGTASAPGPDANAARVSAEALAEHQRQIKLTTAAQAQQAQGAEALFAAYRHGLPALEAANRQQAIATAMGPALAKGDKDLAAALGDYAAREYDAKRALQQRMELDAKSVALRQSLAMANAKVTDVINGNTLASQKAQRQIDLENLARSRSVDLSNKEVQASGREREASDAAAAAAQIRADDAQRDLEFSSQLDEAYAALADAKAGDLQASVQLSAQQEIDNRLRAEGLADLQAMTQAQAERIAAIGDEVNARRDQLAAINDEAAAELEHSRGLGRTTREMEAIAKVRRSEFATVRDYEKALRAANVELEVQRAREEAIAQHAGPLRLAQIEAEIRAQARLREQAIKTEQDSGNLTKAEKWQAAGRAMEQAFSGLDTTLGRVGQALGKMVQQLSAATTNTQRWSAALNAAAAVAAELGPQATEGGFGGRGQSNYAAEGAVVGAIIGAIVAAYFTAGAATEAGAAIGSAAGSIVGAFIKKGADESLGQLELDSGKIVAVVNLSEHGLGWVIRKLGTTINDAIQDVLDAIGGSLLSIPNVSLKVRDGVISVMVGAVLERFKDMDDAMSFAVAEILKQSNITGISDTVRAVLSKTDAADLTQLAKELDFAQWYDSLNIGPAGASIAKAMAEFREKWDYAVKFGLDTAPIGEWFKRQTASIKDALLGLDMSAAERLRNLAGYDAGIDQLATNLQKGADQVAAALADAEKALADLLANAPNPSKDDMSGSYGAGGYGGAAGADGMGHSQAPTGQSDQPSSDSELSEWSTMVQELMAKIPQLRAALEAYLAQLGALPDKLTDQEKELGIWSALEHYLAGSKKYAEMAHKFAQMRVDAEFEALRLQLVAMSKWDEWAQVWADAYAIATNAAAHGGGKGHGGGGGGGDKGPSELEQAIADSRRALAQSGMGEFQRQVDDTNKKWDDLIKEAGLHSNAMAEATRRHEEAIKAAHGNADAIKAADAAYQRQIRNIHATAEEIAEANHQRELELQLIRDQAHARVDAALNPQNQWQQQASDIEKAYDDIRKANQALRDAGVKGVDPKWRVNAAERAELAALTEKAIDSLGLPMEALKDRVKGLGDTLAFVKEQADAGIISQERYGEVLAQVQAQAGKEIMGMAAGLLEQMGNTDEAAKLRRVMQVAEFELQRAQLNFLFEQYRLLGLLSPAVEAAISHALGIINAFDPNDLPLPNANDGSYHRPKPGYQQPDWATEGGGAGGVADDDARRRQEILDQIAEWNKLAGDDATQALRDLGERFDELRVDAVRLGVSLSDLQGAYGAAVEDFWDQALGPYEDPSRLAALEQVADLNRKFDQMVAAANQYGGDLERIEAARQVAVRDFWDQVLGPLRDYQAELSGGSMSTLSPEQKLLQARSRFESTAQAALGGDVNAIQQLPQLIAALLGEAQGYFGTGGAYQALYAQVQAVMAQVLAMAGGSAVSPVALPGAAAANVLPFPVPPPATAAAVGGFSAGDDPERARRLDKLADALAEDAEERRGDRERAREADARVEALLRAVEEQGERIDDLADVVARLAALVESQERRRAG